MQTNGDDHLYQRPDAAVDRRRVEDLLDRMTVQRRPDSWSVRWGGKMGEFNSLDDVKDAVTEHTLGAAATFGWGGSIGTEPGEIVDTVNEIQRLAREETRLGIPVLFNVDAVHGHAYVAGSAIFPNGLGNRRDLGPRPRRASRGYLCDRGPCDGRPPELLAHVRRRPGTPLGSRLRDVRREPAAGRRDGRRESPGYQGDGIGGDENVVATAKHFPAYSNPERGRGRRTRRDIRVPALEHVPPTLRVGHRRGRDLRDAVVHSTNGEPIHGSERFLTDLLRGELGFDGHTVSDWSGVRHLHEDHRVTEDWRESVYRSREAGLTVASVGTTGRRPPPRRPGRGRRPRRSTLDEKVRRVLALKFPLSACSRTLSSTGTRRGGDRRPRGPPREVAREAARNSMTLLQERQPAPLDGAEDVFVAGPNADDKVSQVGGWSVDAEEHVAGDSLPTPSNTMQTRAPSPTNRARRSTRHATSRPRRRRRPRRTSPSSPSAKAGTSTSSVPRARPAWRRASGPTDRTSASADAQRELVQAIHETGTPTVGVLITGRPLIVDWMAEHVPAILMAYYPGSEGGHAIAETLFGDNEPSGRLPVTMPSDEGDLPQHHDFQRQPRPIGDDEHPETYDPLYPFGHGLSYTEFEYGDLDVLSRKSVPARRSNSK